MCYISDRPQAVIERYRARLLVTIVKSQLGERKHITP
jgi:hypothetical protein